MSEKAGTTKLVDAHGKPYDPHILRRKGYGVTG